MDYLEENPPMVIRFFAKPILKSFEDGKKTNCEKCTKALGSVL